MQRLAGRDFDNLFFWNEQTAAFTRQTTAPGGANQDLWVWPDGENTPLLALSQIDWSPPSWSARIIAGDILMTGRSARARVRLADADVAQSGYGRCSVRRGRHRLGVDSPRRWQHRRSRPNGRAVRGTRLETFYVPAAPVHLLGCRLHGERPGRPGQPIEPRLQHRAHLSHGAPFRRSIAAADAAPPPDGPELLVVRNPAVPDVPRRRLWRRRCRLRRDRPGAVRDPLPARRCGDRRRAALRLRRRHRTGDGAAGQRSHRLRALARPAQRRVDARSRRRRQQRNRASRSDTDLRSQFLQRRRRRSVRCRVPSRLAWRADSGELVVDLSDKRCGTGRRCHRQLQRSRFRADSFSTPSLPRAIGWPGPRPMSRATRRPKCSGWAMPRAAGRASWRSTFVGFTFSPDGQALFVSRANGDQLSLSWLSLAADSPPEQLIADALGGRNPARQPARAGHRPLEFAGRIGESGAGRSPQRRAPGAGSRGHRSGGSGSVDGAARVMYAVRGRFASGQDGLWQTTLPAP